MQPAAPRSRSPALTSAPAEPQESHQAPQQLAQPWASLQPSQAKKAATKEKPNSRQRKPNERTAATQLSRPDRNSNGEAKVKLAVKKDRGSIPRMMKVCIQT